MALETINQIREKRNSIREEIKAIDYDAYDSQTYGGGDEYNIKELIGEIEALLTDLSTLTKASQKFIKLSTYSERTIIIKWLTQIEQNFVNPQDYIPYFEELKTLLRTYNVRNSSERQIEFESEIEEARKIKIRLQKELVAVKKIKKEIDKNNSTINDEVEKAESKFTEIESQLKGIIERKDELVGQSETLNEINTNLERIKTEAEEELEEVEDSKTERKSNEKLISSFANRVKDREKKFDELEHNTKNYNETLASYKEEQTKVLEKAKRLIESAKNALNYKTAEGISASFKTQYDKSKNWMVLAVWLIGALAGLGGTVWLGIWVLETEPNQIGLLIGRISLLPLPIAGAIFCANQYTKQKNIIEDYAYKMVISKAIVGFSEQLTKEVPDNRQEYTHYIKTALEEIHKDPLRKREENRKDKNEKSKLNDLIEVAEKIIKISKPE